uniref:26S proteasome complex subunit SEM1 n=1 Tax=Myotis myotis TaxID=51298 RepID=A0A7J7V4N7_MYOMY|nr:SEM1 26S proteasome complex subunit [Myotis myotis]
MSEKKQPVDLGLLEEDDEFEEFPAEDWTGLDEDEDAHVWEDNWDDDNVEDDFSNQLRSHHMVCHGYSKMDQGGEDWRLGDRESILRVGHTVIGKYPKRPTHNKNSSDTSAGRWATWTSYLTAEDGVMCVLTTGGGAEHGGCRRRSPGSGWQWRHCWPLPMHEFHALGL